MVARHQTRRGCPRPTQSHCRVRTSVGHNTIHYLGSILFPQIFLSLFSCQLVSKRWSRLRLTPGRDYSFQPVRCSTIEHHCTSIIRSKCYLSPPRPDNRRLWSNKMGAVCNGSIRNLFHYTPRVRVLRSIFLFRRWSLWLNFLYCYRFPWITCNCWNIISVSLPGPTFKRRI